MIQIIGKTVTANQLSQKQWRLQTDVLKQAFMVAGLFAECGSRAILVDGHFSEELKTLVANSRKPMQLINRRCHKAGLTTRRLIILDTTSEDDFRAHGLKHLHFHGVFEMPPGMKIADFLKLLQRIFGHAVKMGRRQINWQHPNYTLGFTHARRVRGEGPLGKWFYAIRNAGTTYNDLGLNGDGTKRSGPKERVARNAKADGLAKGTGSGFNKEIVIADNGIKALGEAAYYLWLAKQQAAEVATIKPAKKSTGKRLKRLISNDKSAIKKGLPKVSEAPGQSLLDKGVRLLGARRKLRAPG